ncbi:alpha/beta fold hydrolase [Variovorax sp. JS1663]|uniref:alpha/beta fold hydrolase n=1 Tax=Variovorax sp. JS1663 TaxID=1851577 RepID=UPI0023571E29|nr:alpha/beta fold hydrolase [Variovorax sp. JS1663]
MIAAHRHTTPSAMPLKQQIRFCTAPDGVRLAYATAGHGPPLLKVGNWMSHLEFDLTSPVWGHVLEALCATRTLVRYDQRGTGLSDREIEQMSFEIWLKDIETVADAAGLARFPMLAMSQGVSLAIAYAARHPERVSHLVLQGGYARGRRMRGGGQALDEEADTQAKLIEIGWGRSDPAFRQFFTSQFLPEGTPEQHRWFNELESVSTSPKTAARMLREFDRIDVTALLPQVRCPTLVLHSTGDLRVPFDEGRIIAGGIAQARFVPLHSAHHLVLAQDAVWPRWVEEVRDFLAGGDGGTPDPALASLTAREREVLELIAQGRDNAQVAAALQLSEKTVRNHITSVFAKLQVENRPQAIVRAREAGLGRAG